MGKYNIDEFSRRQNEEAQVGKDWVSVLTSGIRALCGLPKAIPKSQDTNGKRLCDPL